MNSPVEPALRGVALVVLDSVGIGGAPDAAEFGDEGSATLQHVAEAVGGLNVPNLAALGLGNVASVEGVPPALDPAASFGSMVERSPGKDTTTGHWEIAGVVLEKPFPTYPDGFPSEVLDPFEEAIGKGTLGNVAASGTEIIARLGERHIETGRPIVYTSADSVFQIAAHVDTIPLKELYRMCETARDILRGPHEVGRVIARPFKGSPGAFERTTDRRDFSVLPPSDTILDELSAEGLEVRGVGKILDIFGGRGVTHSHPTKSNEAGVEAVVEELGRLERGLVFANLVDFDQSFGHRNDPAGYAGALEAFDAGLPALLAALSEDDALVVTADHGNDPTTSSTDHSRERVPLLVTGPRLAAGVDLGVRRSFADLGATVAHLLGVDTTTPGSSFAARLAPRQGGDV